MHLRVAINKGNDASGLLCESVARCVDEVAADVHEGTTSALNLVTNVGRVDVEITEEAADGAEFPDAAFIEQFAKAQPLRITAYHEGFANLDAGMCLDGEESFGLGNGEAERLLAENVLASFCGFDGPGDMQLIGKGIVNGVDFRVGKEFFVRAIGRWDS